MSSIDYLTPDWDAPASVHAVSTTRHGGVSKGAWQGLNLALHVEDDSADVAVNRQVLRNALNLPAEPYWLTQVHGNLVLDASRASDCVADAAFSSHPGDVCAVMTADCLPVLFCNRTGDKVAAAHAGWRGLAAGVLEASLAKFSPGDEVLAWLGPAIGPAAFEVGNDVRATFVQDQADAESAFVENRPGHWLADIYVLARLRLQRAGVDTITGGNFCTYSDPDRFYSFRRDKITGRMASLIWIQ